MMYPWPLCTDRVICGMSFGCNPELGTMAIRGTAELDQAEPTVEFRVVADYSQNGSYEAISTYKFEKIKSAAHSFMLCPLAPCHLRASPRHITHHCTSVEQNIQVEAVLKRRRGVIVVGLWVE